MNIKPQDYAQAEMEMSLRDIGAYLEYCLYCEHRGYEPVPITEYFDGEE